MATTEPRKSSPTDAWREELYAAKPERDGELFSVGGITVRDRRIVAIDFLADPDRLRALDLTVLEG